MSRYSHGANLRRGRASVEGQIYLITTVTHRRRYLFSDIFTGRIVVRTLHFEYLYADTLAYVLMPDHLHWLIQLGHGAEPASVIHRIKSVSAHRIKRDMRIDGRVWQSGYHDHALRREEDVHSIARYIVANPLRAGIVTNVWDYPLWDAIWI